MIPDPSTQCRFGGVPFIRNAHAGKLSRVAQLENGPQFRLWWKFAFFEQLPDRFEVRGLERRYLCHVWHFCAHVDLVKPFFHSSAQKTFNPRL
jgi:hypothetical protein